MHCLFCKCLSDTSRSVEHIIPESLGNHTLVLRPGIVCDKCNNYFARKVEQPFLNHPTVVQLRFHQRLTNKKGRVPPIPAIVAPGDAAALRYHPENSLPELEVSPETLARIMRSTEVKVYLPFFQSPPPDPVISRFVAKIALEAMAKRLEQFPDGLEYLVNELQLDEIRDHARLGKQPKWPVHTRHIYHADGWVLEADGSRSQVIHESDFLVTETGEWYFVLALFGLELAINLAGPEVSGYEAWLVKNGGRSPLYMGKNHNFPMPTTT